MQLHLYHGRDTADEPMDDWGKEGPTLHGVKWLAVTYMDLFRVEFKDQQSYDNALNVTGWEPWDELCLCMKFEEGCVKAGGKFYGDWSLDT